MRVRYTRQALADLLAIADYIGEHNPAAAAKVEAAILSAIDLLADFPRLGRDRPELDARSLGIPRWPYTAYYRIENAEVWIVHIRDDRRRPVERAHALWRWRSDGGVWALRAEAEVGALRAGFF